MAGDTGHQAGGKANPARRSEAGKAPLRTRCPVRQHHDGDGAQKQPDESNRKAAAGSKGAKYPAKAAPSTTGTAQRRTMRHSTCRALTWAAAADSEVKTMQAREVATAAAVLCANGNSPLQSKRMIRAGTMTMPPPMPSRPPRKPLTQPTPTHREAKKIWLNSSKVCDFSLPVYRRCRYAAKPPVC